MIRTRAFAALIIVVLILLVPAIAQAAVDAETVVRGKCTACHSSERIRESSKTKPEWAALVKDEIDRGAQLSDEEEVAVVDWLTQTYGPAEEAATTTEDTQVEDVSETTEEETGATTSEAATSTADAEDALPCDRQAETGVELWQFLITGSALLGGGAWLRRR